MGTQNTPLTGTGVPDWQELPDVPKWMLSSLSHLERYCNIPVASAADRNTKVPSGQRWVGQVTYNADLDRFEYWSGPDGWIEVNRQLNLPASFVSFDATDRTINPGGSGSASFHNHNYEITTTMPCAVCLTVYAAGRWPAAGAWQGIACNPIFNGQVQGRGGAVQIGSADASSNAMGMAFCTERFVCATPGKYTFGAHIVGRNNNGPNVTITESTLWGIRIGRHVNTNAAPAGAWGHW